MDSTQRFRTNGTLCIRTFAGEVLEFLSLPASKHQSLAYTLRFLAVPFASALVWQESVS